MADRVSPTPQYPRSRPRRDPVWSQALTGVALVLGLIGIAIGSTLVTGLGVIALGLACLAWTLTQDSEQVRDRVRGNRTAGPLMTRPMSRVPVRGAKILFGLLSLGIVALGVSAIVAAL